MGDEVVRDMLTYRGGELYREVDLEDEEGYSFSEMGWRVDDEPNAIVACRNIVSRKSAAEVHGVLVDLQTAGAVLSVWDGLKVENRKRLMDLTQGDMTRIGNFCWKLIGRIRAAQS